LIHKYLPREGSPTPGGTWRSPSFRQNGGGAASRIPEVNDPFVYVNFCEFYVVG